MNLSKTSEYAMRIMSFMATRGEDVYSAEYLYEELKIPRRYLRRLLTDLSKANLISSNRGRSGGFSIHRDPFKISLKEILDITEGKDATSKCILGFSCCVAGKPCLLHDEWIKARTLMNQILEKTTLGGLNEKYQLSILNT